MFADEHAIIVENQEKHAIHIEQYNKTIIFYVNIIFYFTIHMVLKTKSKIHGG